MSGPLFGRPSLATMLGSEVGGIEIPLSDQLQLLGRLVEENATLRDNLKKATDVP